jgi:CelD/BcsL family acetyltransferase involved in cellulose biosynthesis
MVEISLAPVADFARLGAAWTALQDRCEASFFQSWAWTGCLVEERFPRPVVLEVRQGGTLIAMALFNAGRRRRGRSTLWLGESGAADLDAVYIEHNGFLLTAGAAPRLLARCLRAAQSGPIGTARARRRRSLVLSGVPAEYLAAARAVPGVARIEATSAAPFVDLDAVRRSGRDFPSGLSANARYQIRRSERCYRACGPLAACRARSLAEAKDFFCALIRLHQAYWTGRGRPGAFANPAVLRFHRALIERAFASGGIELIRVSAGPRALGYLYNFRHRDRVYAYQSGFDYALPHPHCKPGLTCHHLAIERHLAEGAAVYDFLGGAHRYKASLANAETRLYWIALHPRLSAAGLLASLKNLKNALGR